MIHWKRGCGQRRPKKTRRPTRLGRHVAGMEREGKKEGAVPDQNECDMVRRSTQRSQREKDEQKIISSAEGRTHASTIVGVQLPWEGMLGHNVAIIKLRCGHTVNNGVAVTVINRAENKKKTPRWGKLRPLHCLFNSIPSRFSTPMYSASTSSHFELVFFCFLCSHGV